MAKRIKMVLYGEPGVGKSVFASKAPKPFFITTDGNYEWLEDFGAKPEDHKQVSSWSEAKKTFTSSFDGYETIVIDLTEDLFKWCEYEYCVRNKIEHVSDIGFAKGYDTTRNEFFIEICKLINLDKNIIFIMHGMSTVVKDRRGVEHTKHQPTSRIPDKVLDMIEGRVRYFIRCYLKAEEQEDGTLAKKRYLSIVPKENEFGIIRGIDENTIPHDIPLDFEEFAKVIGLDTSETNHKATATETGKKLATSTKKSVEPIIKKEEPKIEKQPEEVNTEGTETENVVHKEEETIDVKINATPVDKVNSESKTDSKPEMSNADKLAAIKAKLAALNKR